MNPSTSSAPATKHKKNLGGGKGHKRSSGREMRGHRANRELTDDFVEDALNNQLPPDVTLARVTKVFGGARMSLLTVTDKEVIAGLKGSLKCSKGAARRADNPLAVTPGTFVVLQEDEFATQIVAILNRSHVRTLQPAYPMAPRGFFAESTGLEEEEGGFEWDHGDEGGKEKKEEEGEEVNVDAI